MKQQKKINTIRKIEYHKKEAFYLIVRGLEVGVVASLVSVFYRFLLSNAEKYLGAILNDIAGSPAKTIAWLLILSALGYIVWLTVKFEPMASGSGIPQVSGEIKGHLSPSWWRVITAKMIGGTLSILGGLSLGREGPSIQLGAMAAKGVAKITKADKTTELRMISCGAGAGLAAAFNAPLSGILFVLEEIEHTFDKSILCMGIVATVTADYISKIFFGQSTIFAYETQNFPLRYYWLLIIMGVVLGFAGAGYNKIMTLGQDLFKKMKKVPQLVKIIGVFVLSGVVGLVLPQVLGGGHNMVELLLNEHPSILVMTVLLFAKFLFSVISFGCGAPGGIFFPMLILGTYIGAIYGDVCIQLFGLDPSLWHGFIVIAMAGIFASIVRSPITGIVLVFEMTGNMNNILPLVTVSLISYAVANFTGVSPIYETLLSKIIANKEGVKTNKKAENVIKSYTIPIASYLDNSYIKETNWGRHCIIVTVERGEESITPAGDVLLHSGDEIVFLINQKHYAKVIANLDKIFEV